VHNPFLAGASPRTPLGELTSYALLQKPLVGWGGVPLRIPFLPRRFRNLDLVQAPRSLGPIKSYGYAYVVREEGAQIILLQGARNLKLRHCLYIVLLMSRPKVIVFVIFIGTTAFYFSAVEQR